MSIADKLMARYYEILLGQELPKGASPIDLKKQLAVEIVQTYHSAAVAEKTLADWNARFSEKRLDEADLPAFAAIGTEALALTVAAYSQCMSIKQAPPDGGRCIILSSVQASEAN